MSANHVVTHAATLIRVAIEMLATEMTDEAARKVAVHMAQSADFSAQQPPLHQRTPRETAPTESNQEKKKKSSKHRRRSIDKRVQMAEEKLAYLQCIRLSEAPTHTSGEGPGSPSSSSAPQSAPQSGPQQPVVPELNVQSTEILVALQSASKRTSQELPKHQPANTLQSEIKQCLHCHLRAYF